MLKAALVLAALGGAPLAVSYFLLRHWLLAALTLAAPVAAFGFSLVLQAPLGVPVAACLFGFVCSLLLCDGIERSICAGQSPRAAVARSCGEVMLAGGPLLAAYGVFLAACGAYFHPWTAPFVLAGLFVLVVTAVLALGWLAVIFPYTEEFVARANAAREWRERRLGRLAVATETRWALSVTGIAIVLATIAGFGIRDVRLPGLSHVWPWLLALGVLFAAGFMAVTRDWRAGLAAALASAFACLLLIWAQLRGPWFFDVDILDGGAWAMAAAMPLAFVAARTRDGLREGDTLAGALGQALRKNAPMALAPAAIFVPIGLISTALSGYLSPWLVFGVASSFATALLFPALTVAIHAVLPRYRSVEEVFGKR